MFKELMVITTTASRAFENILLDIVGPLPRSHNGNVYIFTLQDDPTKFAWATPIKNHETNTVAHHDLCTSMGSHKKSLVNNCGTEFLIQVFKEVSRLL